MKFLLFSIFFAFFPCILKAQVIVSDGVGIGNMRIDSTSWKEMQVDYGKRFHRSRKMSPLTMKRMSDKKVQTKKIIIISCHYQKLGITFEYSKTRQRLFQNLFFPEKQFIAVYRISFEEPFAGQSLRGVQIGDVKEKVMDAYGFSIPFNHQLCYDNIGIRFELDEQDQYVKRIVISRPEKD